MTSSLEKTVDGSQSISFFSPKLDLQDFVEAGNNEDSPVAEVSGLNNDNLESSTSFRCSLCSYQGESREEQVSHYQSSWHVHNVRRQILGKEPISEEEYDDQDTISTDDELTDSDEQQIANLDGNLESILPKLNKSGPRFLFLSRSSGKLFSIFKCVLNNPKEPKVSQLNLLLNEERWAVILVSGGRFAAAVFDRAEPVVHKTFHRYTVRAGQGGAQGSRDSQNSQRAPKSAGAGLRRYNEAALAKEIQTLLGEWNAELKRCAKIFMRFSTYHRSIFFSGAEPLFFREDERIRTVPFPVGKPTFEEVKRVQKRISTVYCHGSLENIRNLLKSKKPIQTKVSPAQKKTVLPDFDSNSDDADDENSEPKTSVKLKKSKEAAREVKKLEQKALPSVSPALRQDLFTACKAENLAVIEAILSSLPEMERNYLINETSGVKLESFLHRAASEGLKTVIPVLLKAGASPLIQTSDGKYPYQLGKDRDTKLVFRNFREANPKLWDWDRAQIPPPLLPEEEKLREERNAEKNRIAKQARKERLKIKKAEEHVRKKEEEERNRYLSLSDREKRALAAERRLRESNPSTVTARCFECGDDMTGKVPFEYSSNVFCTMDCLKKHKAVQKR